jgi:hypothetical protein
MTAARWIARASLAVHVGRLIGHALHYRYVTHLKES